MRAIEPVLGIVRLAVAYEEATAGRGPSERLLPVEALYWLKHMNEQFQSKLYGGEHLAAYLQQLGKSPAEAGHRLAAETSQKLRHAKEDFDRRVIRIEEYKRRIFEALPLAYTGSLPVETGPLGERVLVNPEALATFLRVTPPFGLLDEVELSSGEVGIVVIINPEQPCLPAVRVARTEDGAEVPSGSMKVKMLSGISNLRGHLRVVRQGGRIVDGCFYSLA